MGAERGQQADAGRARSKSASRGVSMAGAEEEVAAGAAAERVQSRRLPVRGLVGEPRPPADCAKRFICSFPDCEATFNKAWRLNAHLCRHTGERPFVCSYKGCGKGFTRDFHLTRHFLTHSGEKPFECMADGCNQKFTTKSNLKKHIERKHDNLQKQYICDYEGCSKSFRKHQQLKVHHCQHTSEPFFKCNHEGCGKHFPTPSRLKRHEKIHEGYACKKDNCSFVGKTWTEHLKHVKDSHAEPVVCDVCSKTFKRKDYLRQHQKTHAEEREQSLTRHSVVHDPDKGKLNLKAKQPRPKRSLASRLSGYIPPKGRRRRKIEEATENGALNKPVENELPTVETLTLH
nr:transcription factor IIIA [Pelodiscus sinensis]|eukprot:XP_014436964.1 transcription factor IIIA [Pelodiscus sinensis]